MLFKLINCCFKNDQYQTTEKHTHTSTNIFWSEKNITFVYWWLYHCALEINTGNCTFLTYVNSHGSRNAQIYERWSASYMQHKVVCPLSILVDVPEENIKARSTNVVPNIGYHVKKTVLTAFNSIGCTSLLNIDNGVFKSSYAIFFKCEHRNWSSDIIVHITFINSEKSFKMNFQRTIQNGIYFQYALYTLKLVVAHNTLQLIHLIGLSI